jgi:hypothetical protein
MQENTLELHEALEAARRRLATAWNEQTRRKAQADIQAIERRLASLRQEDEKEEKR